MKANHLHVVGLLHLETSVPLFGFSVLGRICAFGGWCGAKLILCQRREHTEEQKKTHHANSGAA